MNSSFYRNAPRYAVLLGAVDDLLAQLDLFDELNNFIYREALTPARMRQIRHFNRNPPHDAPVRPLQENEMTL